MKNIRVACLVAGALLAVILGSQAVSAQQTDEPVERITLSPSSRTIKVNSGDVVAGTMKIINNGDVPYDFMLYSRPYSVSNEAYDPDFTAQKPNADLYKWVQFDKTSYSIKPGETVEAKYTLNVPANAAPGGHYGVLFAETKERELGSTGVSRQKRVGKVIYATVNGDYKMSGELKEFILPFWQTGAPIVSSARVSNTGNSDFTTKVSTVATDIFGRTKYKYTGDPIVLPETTRLVEMKWENAPSFGIFKVVQKVDFIDEKHQNKGYVLIAPRWFPILLIVITLAGVWYAVSQRRKNRR